MSNWTGLSASAAGATIACPARLALPQARTTSEAAERGTELHVFARVIIKNPAAREKALFDVPEAWRHTAAGMNLEAALEGLTVKGCEQAFALNVKTQTVRFIGENIERGYAEELARQGQPPLDLYEIPFTIDVVAEYQGTPVELDFKSGQHIGDPSLHWQRRICAIGLMLYYGASTAISRVAYIWEDGRIVPDGCEFSAFDVDDFCETLVRTIDAVEAAKASIAVRVMPVVNPSDEACTYCNAITSCPYYTNFAKSMVGRLQAIENGPELSELTQEEQARVWEECKAAERIAEIVLKGLKKVAAQTPIPIGDKEVRPLAKSRAYFDDAKARGLIYTLLDRSGVPGPEIDKQMKALYGKTEYIEFRKQKKAS